VNVAIIIPAYNAAAYVRETIESCLAQTAPASQVILVDDGSADATSAVAEEFGDAIMVLRQENAGVSAARNLGTTHTTSEWVLFLDADDRMRTDALTKLMSRGSEKALGVIYGQSVDFTEATMLKREHGNCGMQGAVPLGARVAFWKAPIATPGAALIRREVLERAGGWNPRFNTTADRDLWCRIGTIAEFGFVHQIVVERRIHETNMSADKNRARRQAVEVQLNFLEWCSSRSVSTDFLETSVEEIFERNVHRALDERAFAAAAWISEEAGRRGIRSDTLGRALRLAAMPDFARELELKVRGLFS
jgi:glycosyltransferase involved in cell wall biosynthesis